jgi:hypothetical protein
MYPGNDSDEEPLRVIANKVSISLTMDTYLVAKIDSLRGDTSRSAYVCRILNKHLFKKG